MLVEEVDVGMDPLQSDLLARIRARASDPEARTDAPPTTRGKQVGVGNVSVVGIDLGRLLRGDPAPEPPAGSDSLSSALDNPALDDAERRLGFALPPPLRQLYAEIGDGGFGPGPGLMRLEDVVRTYVALTATPPGRRGQTWPKRLLPFTRSDPGHDCIDIDSGEIIFWDEEELAAGASDKVWKRSFKAEAADLSAWFERWLATASPEQRMKRQMEDAQIEAIRQSLAYWRAKTPKERAEFGLPETGWEKALFGHLGIDLSKL